MISFSRFLRGSALFIIFFVSVFSTMGSSAAQLDIVGFWEIDEKGQRLFVTVGPGGGHGNVVWHIKKNENNKSNYDIIIFNRDNLKFENVPLRRNRITYIITESQKIDVEFSKNTLKGTFSYGTQFSVTGKPSRYVADARKAAQKARQSIGPLSEKIEKIDDQLSKSRRNEIRLKKKLKEKNTNFNKLRMKLSKLTKEHDRLKVKNEKLDQSLAKMENTLGDKESNIADLNKKLVESRFALKKEQKSGNAFKDEIDKLKNMRARISTEMFEPVHLSTRADAVRFAPDPDARKVGELKKDDAVMVMYERPQDKWLLIATAKGVVGFVPADSVRFAEKKRKKQLPRAQGIVVTSPVFELGGNGKRVKVEALGYLSLHGYVNLKNPVERFTMNGRNVDLEADGSFVAVPVIQSARQTIELVATDDAERSTELTIDVFMEAP
jgi:hypothetical protein